MNYSIMKIPLRIAIASLALVLCTVKLYATPYASCLTNNAGTIQFYLNEGGANVTVTYEDSSVDPNYNGTTTGLNLASGLHSFALGSHTSYSISVFKAGSGVASIIQTMSASTPRGIDVNKRPQSPFFGYVYAINSSGTLTNSQGAVTNVIRLLNSDLTGVLTNGGGVSWITSSSDPYRLAVNDDDYLTVGSFSSAHSGVWRLDPTLTTNQLLLGPVGQTAGYAAMSQGDQFSRPLLIGNLAAGGSAVLYTVDAGTIPNVNANQLNSVLVYSNLTLATLPRETPPDLLGPEVCLNISVQNNYPGITAGPVNQTPTRYLYCSNRRDGPSGGSPTVCIYALTNLDVDTSANGGGTPTPGANAVWNSFYNGGVNDYFAVPNGSPTAATTTGPADSAVSPDGQYFAALGYGDCHIIVCSLTNGIPDVSTLYTIYQNPNPGSAGRGICWDAADNLYVSASALAEYQEWTLGGTATTITTGNANGSTGFSVELPSIAVGVTATNSIGTETVSQANSYGNPTNATFVITRTGSTASALTVFFTYGGTAGSKTYTATASGSVTIAAGQSSTNITITAVTDGVARPTTTIVLNLSGSATYSLSPQNATLSLINTAPDELVASVGAPTMYNAFSNDFASIVVSRWGDTNAATFTASSFNLAGTAVAGTDYTAPTPVTFNPGDLTQTSYIQPLYQGQLPVQTTGLSYVGNKTVVVNMGSGPGYSGSTSNAVLTILDQSYPPAAVLFADPLTSPSDASNWGVTAANNNMQNVAIDTGIAGTSQSSIIFGYSLQDGDPGDFGAIPLPPSGAATALRVTANKSAGYAAGVNLYPTNEFFSGNYAVRFSMNLIQGYNNTVSTEGPLVGINHSGIATNWFSTSTLISGWGPAPGSEIWESDGVWYWINADNDDGAGAYQEFTGLGGSLPNTGWTQPATALAGSYANSFKSNDFSGGIYWGSGLVSGASIINDSAGLNNNWADVEIKQFNKVVTLSIDKTPVFVYTNTTTFTNGTLMLGYDDPFSSLGTPDAGVYFSDLQVVRLTPPAFNATSGIVVSGGNVTLTFSSPDATATFVLQSAPSVFGPWTDVSPQPTLVSLGGGNYQFTTPQSGAERFYKIRY